MSSGIEERNIHSVREQSLCLNAHDIDCFLRFLAPDFAWRSDLVPVPHQGIEAARQGLAQIFAVFPDIHFRELALYPGGNAVTGVFEVGGSEIRPGPGSLLPPIRNHPWHMNQAIIHTFDEEGNMTMVWLFANVAALMQQLGLLPSGAGTFGAAPGPQAGPGGSIFTMLMGLPLRLLHGLLVVMEASLGIEPDGDWPDDDTWGDTWGDSWGDTDDFRGTSGCVECGSQSSMDGCRPFPTRLYTRSQRDEHEREHQRTEQAGGHGDLGGFLQPG